MQTKMQLCMGMLAAVILMGAELVLVSGAYAGVGVGVTTLNTTDNNVFSSVGAANGYTSDDLDGNTGRVFAGYHISRFVGVEVGYAKYASSLYKGTLIGAKSSLKNSTNALDLIGKAYLPVTNSGFNVYALGGVAEVFGETDDDNASVPLEDNVSPPDNGTTTTHHLRPKIGVGMSYDISSSVSASVELSRIRGAGNILDDSEATPDADMLSVSLTYKFD